MGPSLSPRSSHYGSLCSYYKSSSTLIIFFYLGRYHPRLFFWLQSGSVPRDFLFTSVVSESIFALPRDCIFISVASESFFLRLPWTFRLFYRGHFRSWILVSFLMQYIFFCFITFLSFLPYYFQFSPSAFGSILLQGNTDSETRLSSSTVSTLC